MPMCYRVVEMDHTTKGKGLHRLSSRPFIFVRDPALNKLDVNTRRVHSKLPLDLCHCK